jgi:hypothetical protein
VGWQAKVSNKLGLWALIMDREKVARELVKISRLIESNEANYDKHLASFKGHLKEAISELEKMYDESTSLYADSKSNSWKDKSRRIGKTINILNREYLIW